MLEVYKTGVQYQFYNTFRTFCSFFIYSLKPDSKKKYLSLWLILFWYVYFSFSLYALTLLSMPILGAITPIGGSILLIIGWLTLTYGILKTDFMKKFTILGTGWLGFELAKQKKNKNKYEIVVSARNDDKLFQFRS